MAAAGGDVDRRRLADAAGRRRGSAIGGPGTCAVQGNLDPAALLAPREAVERETRAVLAAPRGRDGHVFNLGHGVLPATPLEHLQRVVDLVHDETERTPASDASPAAPVGVLVMAYGTASGPDDIERYYTDIRGGRSAQPRAPAGAAGSVRRDRQRLPAARHDARAGRGSGRASQRRRRRPHLPRVPRHEALAAVHPRGRRGHARRRRRREASAS